MVFVHPTDHERFALRLLLLYRKGCSSFQELRTVNNKQYNTFREACLALGFLDDDNESIVCLEEAASFASPKQLRDLFVVILLNCTPSNPRQLWEKYKNLMTEDILYQAKINYKNNNLQFNEHFYNIALNDINNQLQKTGNHLSNYPEMPNLMPISTELPNDLMLNEMNYNVSENENELNINLSKLNSDQKKIYDAIIDRVNNRIYGKNILKTFQFFLLLMSGFCYFYIE